MSCELNEAASSQRQVAPLIRWAGSKRRLLPRLAEYWEPKRHLRYVEPFAGSSALFFHLNPQEGLLNDLNSELISTYEALAKSPEQVYLLASQIKNGEDTYYKIRAIDPISLDPLQRAARFIYLNRFCFNGIFRTNKKGQFNVPYGGEKSGALPSLDRFEEMAKRLRNARFFNIDFEAFVKQEVRAGDFVYLDPPYAVSNRRIFRQYDPNTFGTEDVERLERLLEEIDLRGATFLVSYALSAEVKSLLKRWRSRRVHTQRNIAGFSEHRRRAVEVMVTNLG